MMHVGERLVGVARTFQMSKHGGARRALRAGHMRLRYSPIPTLMRSLSVTPVPTLTASISTLSAALSRTGREA